jgi:hypothetical protein
VASMCAAEGQRPSGTCTDPTARFRRFQSCCLSATTPQHAPVPSHCHCHCRNQKQRIPACDRQLHTQPTAPLLAMPGQCCFRQAAPVCCCQGVAPHPSAAGLQAACVPHNRSAWHMWRMAHHMCHALYRRNVSTTDRGQRAPLWSIRCHSSRSSKGAHRLCEATHSVEAGNDAAGAHRPGSLVLSAHDFGACASSWRPPACLKQAP